MSDSVHGKRMRIPRSRRLTWDLLHFNRQIPLCAHDRKMDLSVVASSRQRCTVRISWPALFVKAYAQVAAEIPELRQTWYRWPWSHLYQHHSSTSAMTVHRVVRDQPWLFWGLIAEPEHLSLKQLQQQIDNFRDGPAKTVFRQQWQLSGLPTMLRRLVWWWNLNMATAGRARRIGTFFLSTLSGRGVEIQLPPSVHTGCLTYGPLDAANCCRVTLAYDHRIMDGVLIADALQKLEHRLNHECAAELDQMADQ